MNLQTKICSHPIFIIGSPRSGTSILAEALAQHTELWTSQESDILFDLFGKGRHVSRAYRKTKGRRTNGWLHTHEVDEAEYLAYVGLGMNALFTSRSEGRRWIDQTPQYTHMVDLLAGMFPGAYFVHMLRDGRRVVHSMTNYLGPSGSVPEGLVPGQVPDWATGFEEACQAWRRHVEIAMDFCEKGPERCLTVVNEDLAADPEGKFRQICDFVGVPFEENMAEYFQVNRSNSSFGSDSVSGPGEQQLSQPWRGWSLDQKTTFFHQAGPTLVRAGLASEEELNPLGGHNKVAGPNGRAQEPGEVSETSPRPPNHKRRRQIHRLKKQKQRLTQQNLRLEAEVRKLERLLQEVQGSRAMKLERKLTHACSRLVRWILRKGSHTR